MKCPECGCREIKIAATVWAEVDFDENDDHDLQSTDGDVEWEDNSAALCRGQNCSWHGTVAQLTPG